MDITIHGLTTDQRNMLDTIWDIDSTEDFEDFVDGLNVGKRQQVSTLCIMMKHEYLEEDLADMNVYPDADALFAKIARTGNT